MKALKPSAPSACCPSMCGSDGPVSAPHRPKSVTTLRSAMSRLARNRSTVVTGG